jgi:hypothetical protein
MYYISIYYIVSKLLIIVQQVSLDEQALMESRMKSGEHIRHMLDNARKVTICLEGWSKKGLTCSFLGISANFIDPTADESKHVTLALKQLKHPHTGEMLATELDTCLTAWGLVADKILMIVTDNGASMVKAIKLVGEWNDADGEKIDSQGAVGEDSSSESLSEDDCGGEENASNVAE